MARSTFRNTSEEMASLIGRFVSERACERLAVSFTHVVDLGDPAAVAELFTEDGEFTTPAGTAHGREQIAAYFVALRAATGSTRHVMSNVRIQVDEDRTGAEGIAYVQVFVAGERLPALVGHLRDSFHLDPDGWRLRRRRIEPVAVDPAVEWPVP